MSIVRAGGLLASLMRRGTVGRGVSSRGYASPLWRLEEEIDRILDAAEVWKVASSDKREVDGKRQIRKGVSWTLERLLWE